MVSKLSRILAGAAVALALLPATAASAQTNEVLVSRSVEAVRSTEVSYSDLDLGNAADVERLRTRVRLAANRVCPIDSYLELDAANAGRACRAASFQRGSAQVTQLASLSGQGQLAAASGSITVAAVR